MGSIVSQGTDVGADVGRGLSGDGPNVLNRILYGGKDLLAPLIHGQHLESRSI